MTIMFKLTVATWANAIMISWAHTKEMVANASGRAESFTPGSLASIRGPAIYTASCQLKTRRLHVQ